MEKNEISMLLDVKIDVADIKNEAGRLRNWTNCTVKIEAVKSFPCFFRITFVHNIEIESENLCVVVHVPGVTQRLTNSRTKSYSYGITWKHNRKRCHIFFAFETQISFERHMKWLKETLKNLELYRRETRRKSRDGSKFLNLQKPIKSMPFKTVQDILGPLPKIPDKRERRVSTVSGIYEEILESENSRRLSQESGIYEEMKAPRDINMLFQNESPPELPARSRINTFENESFETIPRCNTNPESIIAAKKNKIFLQGLQNSLFGRRSKRSESVSESKVSTPEDLIDIPKCVTSDYHNSSKETKPDKHIYQNVDIVFENMISPSIGEIFIDNEQKNRNSFSNPDLSKINSKPILSRNDDIILKSSSILDICETSQSTENIHSIDNDLLRQSIIKTNSASILCNDCDDNEAFNISDRITENFNFSINSSTINLVGADLNIQSTDTLNCPNNMSNRIIDDVSGYCAMIPIKRKLNKNYEKNYVHNIMSAESKKNLYHCRKLSDSDKENFDHFIKLKQNDKNDCNLQENIISASKYETSNNLYLNKNKKLNLSKNEIENYYQSPKKSINIDEKFPSYYPNDCDIKKSPNIKQRSPSTSGENLSSKISPYRSKSYHLEELQIKGTENMYISPAQKIIKQVIKEKNNKTLKNIDKLNEVKKNTPIKACKISENVYSVRRLQDEVRIGAVKRKNCIHANNEQFSPLSNTSEESATANTISFGTLLQSIDFKFDDSKNLNIDAQKVNNRIYQNYSEVSLSTPSNKYHTLSTVHSNNSKSEKTPTTGNMLTPELNSAKKITSLPRFKKIDFSPLKLKINNVLQRNNTEGY